MAFASTKFRDLVDSKMPPVSQVCCHSFFHQTFLLRFIFIKYLLPVVHVTNSSE